MSNTQTFNSGDRVRYIGPDLAHIPLYNNKQGIVDGISPNATGNYYVDFGYPTGTLCMQPNELEPDTTIQLPLGFSSGAATPSNSNPGQLSLAKLMQESLDAYYSNPFMTEDSVIDKPGCQHEYKQYTGLFETYQYCTKCDKKA